MTLRFLWLGVAALLLVLAPNTSEAQRTQTGSASSQSESTFSANVERVVSGDTYRIRRAGDPGMDARRMRTLTARLWGADAPEATQPNGQRVINRAEEFLMGRTVQVFVVRRLGDGNVIVRIEAEEVDLGKQLLAEGFAWYDSTGVRGAPGAVEMRQLEQLARSEERGLWAQERPTPPWEWRNRNQ